MDNDDLTPCANPLRHSGRSRAEIPAQFLASSTTPGYHPSRNRKAIPYLTWVAPPFRLTGGTARARLRVAGNPHEISKNL